MGGGVNNIAHRAIAPATTEVFYEASGFEVEGSLNKEGGVWMGDGGLSVPREKPSSRQQTSGDKRHHLRILHPGQPRGPIWRKNDKLLAPTAKWVRVPDFCVVFAWPWISGHLDKNLFLGHGKGRVGSSLLKGKGDANLKLFLIWDGISFWCEKNAEEKRRKNICSKYPKLRKMGNICRIIINDSNMAALKK